jgi:hypothetical protein
MLFFRSEEQVRAWCAERGYPVRPLATIDQLWGMATAFYGTRLQENARRPQPQEIRGIFASLGLDDEFWDPLSDSFGPSLATALPKSVK